MLINKHRYSLVPFIRDPPEVTSGSLQGPAKRQTPVRRRQTEELLIAISDGWHAEVPALSAGPRRQTRPLETSAIQLLFSTAPETVTSASEATSATNEAQAIQAWDAVLNNHYRGPTATGIRASK
ncbi:hypothetical protein [Burkholderia stabilis]|uniref:hypothetical protein n=1 Tax=Burkholderia stabilis TaxID=95485 RepID=UPI001F4A4B5F|nr:hypothetical protein [Burkholderia stabilis]